ncbi:hypothetical protein MESS2_p110012 [Mesorhizobium metallidurans STM 2683]|uniref:Uncharacterized protein n=1 Tax=Mesorhizobium metallidurans STM 2683 TaxID=1297569 RepID=M5EZC5_9HYPH|nr:hypothetical protein MESS2_p110012 [Mesorhizobium metallidurans STM 2683]
MRRCQQDDPGSSADTGRDVAGPHPETIFRFQLDGHHGCPSGADDSLVSCIHRIAYEHFIARVRKCHHRGEKGRLRTRKTQDIFRGDRSPDASRIVFRKRFEKLRLPLLGSILCSASPDCGYRGFL